MTWSAETRLTHAPKWSADPSIAVSGESVYVVWHDRRDQGGVGREPDHEIYWQYSTDGGVHWSKDIRLTNSPNESRLPSVATSGSVVHVVWEDSRDGSSAIYYKRNLAAERNTRSTR